MRQLDALAARMLPALCRVQAARGAARLVADALATTKACGAAGLVIVRADSAYDNP